MTFEEKILNIIERFGPVSTDRIEIKLIEEFGLSMHAECSDRWFKDEDWLPKLLRTLAERREVIEIEYERGGVDEDGPWQEPPRSLYVSKLTEIKIHGRD